MLENVKQALEDIGVLGMSVDQTKGFGRQLGQAEHFRGSSYALNLIPKTRIEIVIQDQMVEEVIATIVETAQTGELGDGKIFVSSVEQAIRISTGERGDSALR